MIERPKFNTYREYMNWRLDRRLEYITKKIDKYKRRVIDKIPTEDDAGELDRQWLDQFAVGNGLDIACGDFLIGDSKGVDGYGTIGVDYFYQGDELTFQQPNALDFIVTNYFDAFPNTLKALNEWHRCLKAGGVLAIVCRDAEVYNTVLGPLENDNRTSLYTEKTMSQYLNRAKFKNIQIEHNLKSKSLRVHSEACK